MMTENVAIETGFYRVNLLKKTYKTGVFRAVAKIRVPQGEKNAKDLVPSGLCFRCESFLLSK